MHIQWQELSGRKRLCIHSTCILYILVRETPDLVLESLKENYTVLMKNDYLFKNQDFVLINDMKINLVCSGSKQQTIKDFAVSSAWG